MIAKAHLRAAVFSIHGHNLASRISVFSRAVRAKAPLDFLCAQGYSLRRLMARFQATGGG